MFEKNKPRTLNQTLNLTDKLNKRTDNVDKSKRELPSKFTMLEKPYVWSWLCDVMCYFTNHALW